jgi:hypothetical protein
VKVPNITAPKLQLLALLVDHKTENYRIEIVHEKNRWDVKIIFTDKGLRGVGVGSTFDEAWDDVIDPRLVEPVHESQRTIADEQLRARFREEAAKCLGEKQQNRKSPGENKND